MISGYIQRTKYNPKIENYVNKQHAPPESFSESFESSVCNVDDTCREQQAIKTKEVSLKIYQQNQFDISLPKQKDRIFSSKMKTQECVDSIVKKNNHVISEHQKKNPFQNSPCPQRKLSDIQSVTDKDSQYSSQQSFHQNSKINAIKQVQIADKKDQSKIAASYTQLAQKLYYGEQQEPILRNPSQHTPIQRITSSTNVLNTHTSQSRQYVVSEHSEFFQDILKDKVIMTTQDQSHRQIEKILSDNEILFKLSKQPIFQDGIRSDANIIRQPISNFKKRNTLITFKHIVQSMLNNDVDRFIGLMRDSNYSFLNQIDILGNTILIISIKLFGLHKKYDELLKEVIRMNPDPFIKNNINGWSAMDESLSQRSIYATALLFQQCYKKKRGEFQDQFISLTNLLSKVPNFQLDMNWNFDSPLPFIKMLAPSDTIKLYKFNQYLRLDSTLVGFSKLQCKRRNTSLIFKQNKLYQINRSNQFYTDPLEELDTEEKKLIIYDILNCEPVSGAIDITSCKIKECTDWRGKKVIEQIGQYECEKYDLKISYKSSMLKKSNDTQIKFAVERELYEEWILKDIKPNIELLKNSKPKEQNENRTISLWICKAHSLNFKDFAYIVSLLAKGNHLMEKLNSLFQRPEMQEIIQLNGFPIKVQIPFQFSIHATIQFCNFSALNTPNDLFTIPNIKYLPRKEAQKILQQKKKRLLLANLYL